MHTIGQYSNYVHAQLDQTVCLCRCWVARGKLKNAWKFCPCVQVYRLEFGDVWVCVCGCVWVCVYVCVWVCVVCMYVCVCVMWGGHVKNKVTSGKAWKFHFLFRYGAVCVCVCTTCMCHCWASSVRNAGLNWSCLADGDREGDTGWMSLLRQPTKHLQDDADE